ncbi:hypothetical protein EGJ48_03375 [Pantoea dispersa]|uniref:hypothetical protein n=1 Tax=Pantoea dispersa TaxID=59814 RepID=UPI000F67D89D|nr:hypothetical protein [Pantoea dispersa]RRW77600.1 hypothetical protein EGJ48_03375 [Pantoea dispersa]
MSSTILVLVPGTTQVYAYIIGDYEYSESQLNTMYPGYDFADYTAGAYIPVGSYFNSADQLFYVDQAFSHTWGWISSEDSYNQMNVQLRANARLIMDSLQSPYTDNESKTWWMQVEEAEKWTADNSYVPLLLNAMVASSGGNWTLSDLATQIIANNTSWRAACGDVFGQQKIKGVALSAMKAEIDAGTKTYVDMLNMDVSLTAPIVTITDKFS